METNIINKSFQIHNVPLEEVNIKQSFVKITLDDINGNRHTVLFNPFQAFKTTTSDCFDKEILVESENYRGGHYKRHILEVKNSQWLNSLIDSLKLIDDSADFLQNSHHYIIDCGDNIYEVIAHNIEFS